MKRHLLRILLAACYMAGLSEALQASSSMTTQTGVPWALDRVDQRTSEGDGNYQYASDGSGVTIYVIDTGVRVEHPEFGGRVIGSESFVGNGTDKSNGQDCSWSAFSGYYAGHGTEVAAIAAGAHFGVAKGANIYSLQVATCDSLESTFNDIIKAFNRVIALVESEPSARSVINFSGIDTSTFSQNQKERIAQRISELTDIYNVPVVISAGGNVTNTNPAFSPDACSFTAGAMSANALVVGASQVNDVIAPYSSWGNCIDIFAPGGSLFSESGSFAPDPSYTVTSATLNYPTDSFTYFGGSSAAAPFVTGAIARYLQSHPTATVAQVNQAIRNNATLHAVTIDNSSQTTARNDMLYIPPEW